MGKLKQYLSLESSLWRYLNGTATLIWVQSRITREYKDELHNVVGYEVLFMSTSWCMNPLPLGG